MRAAAAAASNRPVEDVHLLSKEPGSVVATFVVLFPSASASEAHEFATLVRDNPSSVASANPDLAVYGPVEGQVSCRPQAACRCELHCTFPSTTQRGSEVIPPGWRH